jgi:hypothetical protein
LLQLLGGARKLLIEVRRRRNADIGKKNRSRGEDSER